MASWMIHLRIADLMLNELKDIDEAAFVMGNIAPDSGVPNEDWTNNHPPKNVSHYKTKPDDPTKEHYTFQGWCNVNTATNNGIL